MRNAPADWLIREDREVRETLKRGLREALNAARPTAEQAALIDAAVSVYLAAASRKDAGRAPRFIRFLAFGADPKYARVAIAQRYGREEG